MEYHALAVGIDYKLFEWLKEALEVRNIYFTYALTISQGVRQFAQKAYHMVLIDLQDIRPQHRPDLLIGLRKARLVPLFVLVNAESSEEEVARILDFGVDLCLPNNTSPLLIQKYTKALIRRYTSYNHMGKLNQIEAVPFIHRNIYIDPLRHTVIVGDEPVDMRPREFALLLFFMQNPGIVLTPEQIQESAWENDRGYEHSAVQAVHELRKLIEPDPGSPIYIETVRRVGYRLISKEVGTCGEEYGIKIERK